MPFMFIWTVMLSIPFGMAIGVIGLVQYVEFFGHLDYWAVHGLSLLITAIVIFALWRRIESIRVVTAAPWIIMLISVAGLTWAHHRGAWPFGPRQITEAFLPDNVNAKAESRVSSNRDTR